MQNEIIELRKQGMGYREIASTLNCTKATVVYYCRKSDLGGVRGNGALSGNQYYTSYEDAEVMFERNFNEVYEGKFIYVGGYKGCDQKFTMKCCICGSEQERSAYVVRHKKNIECASCKEHNKRTEAIEQDEIKERTALIKTIERQIRKIRAKAVIQDKAKDKPKYTIECKRCGEVFDANSKTRVFCSLKCANRHASTIKTFKRRKRLEENGSAEWDISIYKLVKRDKVCKLCGLPIDYKDYKLTPEKYFIAGGNYPSIDHIMPVSKGGTHTWNNVQLAHCRCNTMKNDNVHIMD